MNFMANKMAKSNPQMQQLAQFKQFMQTMQGRDPQAIINDMVTQGRFSREQPEQGKAMGT